MHGSGCVVSVFKFELRWISFVVSWLFERLLFAALQPEKKHGCRTVLQDFEKREVFGANGANGAFAETHGAFGWRPSPVGLLKTQTTATASWPEASFALPL